MSEIKPCGNCGCSPTMLKKKNRYRYSCNGCWTETSWYGISDSALTEWNNIADANAAKNAIHRYKYDVCGYTGEVILRGPHSHEDIVLAIVNNLNYFDYEEVPE